MRTAIILVAGLVLLGVLVLTGWRYGNGAPSAVTAAQIFIPLWLAATLFNMWLGVARAGYSVAEELPIFLLLFGLPAAVAGFLWWKYS